MTPEDVAAEEAGHAVACVLLGIDCVGARFEWGLNGILAGGRTLTPNLLDDLDRDRGRDILVMLMCGPIMGDRGLPEWPPSRDAYQQDEVHIAIFGDYLGLNEASWHGLRAAAYRFTCSDECMNLYTAVMGVFEHTPTIDRSALALAQRIGGVT